MSLRFRFPPRFVLVLAAFVAFLSLVGGALPAWADDSPLDQAINSADAKADRTSSPAGNTLVALKTNAAAEIAKRQRALDRLAAQLADSPADCGQNQLLQTRVADTSAALSELAGQIAAAPDLKAAKAVAGDLYPRTRVFSLVVPQVHVSLACNDAVATAASLTARIAASQATLETIKAQPESQAAFAAVGPATAAVKGIGSLAAVAQLAAGLVADRGDAAALAANTAAIASARTQVAGVVTSTLAAARNVRELERLTDAAKRAANRAAKGKKPVK